MRLILYHGTGVSSSQINYPFRPLPGRGKVKGFFFEETPTRKSLYQHVFDLQISRRIPVQKYIWRRKIRRARKEDVQITA